MSPLEVNISVDFVVKAKGSLPLEEKLLEDAILGAVRAAKESFRESTWLSWRQGHCPPPFGAVEEEERRDFKVSLWIYHQAPSAEFVDPPPKRGKH